MDYVKFISLKLVRIILSCLRLTVGAVDFAGEMTACAVPYALVTFAICDYGACRSFSGTPARGAN